MIMGDAKGCINRWERKRAAELPVAGGSGMFTSRPPTGPMDMEGPAGSLHFLYDLPALKPHGLAGVGRGSFSTNG
jgi:hypothetical protein